MTKERAILHSFLLRFDTIFFLIYADDTSNSLPPVWDRGNEFIVASAKATCVLLRPPELHTAVSPLWISGSTRQVLSLFDSSFRLIHCYSWCGSKSSSPPRRVWQILQVCVLVCLWGKSTKEPAGLADRKTASWLECPSPLTDLIFFKRVLGIY